MAGAVTAGVGAMLIAWALTIAVGAELAGAVMNRMITRVLLPAAVVVFLLSSVATYQQWLVTWISQIPDDIGRAITGGLRGTVVNSGDPFDNVWNKAYVAGAAVFTNLPFSLKGAVLALVVIAYWIAAAAAVLLAFAMFVTSKVLLQLLVAVSPRVRRRRGVPAEPVPAARLCRWGRRGDHRADPGGRAPGHRVQRREPAAGAGLGVGGQRQCDRAHRLAADHRLCARW